MLAIGGNSLIRLKGRSSFADQLATVAETCRPIADLVEVGHQVVVTHGNGPQVGFLLIRSHLSRNRLSEIPLDACNAITQAEIGYMIQQALDNEFSLRGIRKGVVTVVTQVVVDKEDPAFRSPSKPVGPFYTKGEAGLLQRDSGWNMSEDAGRGFRRLVPSPRPVEIVEQEQIAGLLDAGFVVVACGGGGIPVVRQECRLRGVAAVIDKDLSSSLLARRIGAQALVMSTGVEHVYLDYGRKNQQPLGNVRTQEMREYLSAGQFAAGSMGPKVEAALEFLESDEVRNQNSDTRNQKPKAGRGIQTTDDGVQRAVVITDPEHITQAMRGEAGTRITE